MKVPFTPAKFRERTLLKLSLFRRRVSSGVLSLCSLDGKTKIKATHLQTTKANLLPTIKAILLKDLSKVTLLKAPSKDILLKAISKDTIPINNNKDRIIQIKVSMILRELWETTKMNKESTLASGDPLFTKTTE